MGIGSNVSWSQQLSSRGSDNFADKRSIPPSCVSRQSTQVIPLRCWDSFRILHPRIEEIRLLSIMKKQGKFYHRRVPSQSRRGMVENQNHHQHHTHQLQTASRSIASIRISLHPSPKLRHHQACPHDRRYFENHSAAWFAYPFAFE